jgi:hypothetical protein
MRTLTSYVSTLLQKKDITKSSPYQVALAKAASTSQAFLDYADGLYAKFKPLGAETLIADVLKGLTDSALSVWGEYRKAEEGVQKNIINQLIGFKWKHFDEIAVAP